MRALFCLLCLLSASAGASAQVPIAHDALNQTVGTYVGQGDNGGQSIALISSTGYSFSVNQITGALDSYHVSQAGSDVQTWSGPLFVSVNCSGQPFIQFTPSFGTSPLIGGFVFPLYGVVWFTHKTEVSTSRSFSSTLDQNGQCTQTSVTTPRALMVFPNDEATTGVRSTGYSPPVTLSILMLQLFRDGFEPS